MNEPVDVVIAWVDGNDPIWRAEKLKYNPANPLPDSGEHHFRDWGLLRYLFRGIEKYMPWIRKVHFVTWGHFPKWLDTNYERLHIVRHEDYIPADYLPTFSSHAIELNFHRIEGLADRFVYFNDDQYIMRAAGEEFFFKGDVPVDFAALNVHCYSLSRPIDYIQVRDVGVINEHFDFKQSIKRNSTKWVRPGAGRELLRTVPLLGCPRFPGFFQTHCAQALLKATYEEVWAAETEILDETCRNRFRQITDVNQWVFREWQMASGRFYPRSRNQFEPYYLDKTDPIKGSERIARSITRQERTLICINDAEMSQAAFESSKSIIATAFEKLLPEKSGFEKAGVA